MSKDLQALLIRQKIVTPDQVRHAVAATDEGGAGMTWIEHLLLSNVLDENDLAGHLAHELAVPLCGLERLGAIAANALELMPADLAIEHRIIPISIEPDGDLCAAMIDPCDRTALQMVEFFLGRRVLREVAPATTIAWALHTYYREPSALWPPRQIRAQTSPYLELVVA